MQYSLGSLFSCIQGQRMNVLWLKSLFDKPIIMASRICDVELLFSGEGRIEVERYRLKSGNELEQRQQKNMKFF